MTVPCTHAPPCSLDRRPCAPCGHCNAPLGIWCAPRCQGKPERVGEPVEDVGPERWPVEYFAGMPREEQRALVTFMLDRDGPEADGFAPIEPPEMPTLGSAEFDFAIIGAAGDPPVLTDPAEIEAALPLSMPPGAREELRARLRRMSEASAVFVLPEGAEVRLLPSDDKETT